MIISQTNVRYFIYIGANNDRLNTYIWILGIITGVNALLFTALNKTEKANKLYLAADLLISAGCLVILYWIFI